MKLINKTLRCSNCGCRFFPDAMTCPKCGKAYGNKRTTFNSFLTFNGINCKSNIRETDIDIKTLAV
jgi:uncharacterized membrane protein YvbJ